MSRAGSTARPGAARARWVTRALTGSNKNAGIDRRDSCRALTEPFGAAAVGPAGYRVAPARVALARLSPARVTLARFSPGSRAAR